MLWLLCELRLIKRSTSRKSSVSGFCKRAQKILVFIKWKNILSILVRGQYAEQPLSHIAANFQ